MATRRSQRILATQAASSSSPNQQMSKREEWKTLTVEERLNRLGDSCQSVRDRQYEADTYVLAPKFEAGDPVVVCYEGIYYNAMVGVVLKKAWDCPDLKKKVPLYRIRYPSTKKSKTEEVAEYDLMGVTKHTVLHELLYAHYWNKGKLQTGTTQKKDPANEIFELPAGVLQDMQKVWHEHIQRAEPGVRSFTEWIGME
ncbi:uncharacterized protein LOC129582914 [Paramacrobiotus metropolitanus]|uniref:uncharacterized protein LOC129582914 n=1 Tax=Paramacrobiotus metropolitanus TaxID=2943436 RepID=UPI0024458077|nr:uncharacterized protein LOC129582914 [Paramacrobiotus metropolitanus]